MTGNKFGPSTPVIMKYSVREQSNMLGWFIFTSRTCVQIMSTFSFFRKAGPNFIELLSIKICLALNFFLLKNRITNQISICCVFLITCIQLLCGYPENHVEIWLITLLLSRKKFHAKQLFVQSSSMKLGPCLAFVFLGLLIMVQASIRGHKF